MPTRLDINSPFQSYLYRRISDEDEKGAVLETIVDALKKADYKLKMGKGTTIEAYNKQGELELTIGLVPGEVDNILLRARSHLGTRALGVIKEAAGLSIDEPSGETH